MHEGLTLAIVGRPNVGKSSLFNRLVERERAIVTATPGTTRDLVSETVAIGGIPVRLVDTAGIRTALDEAESIGVRKSMEALAEADLVLVVLDLTDYSEADLETDMQLLEKSRQRPRILVCNKCDLHTEDRRAFIRKLSIDEQGPLGIFTSAITGEGIEQLRAMILEKVGGDSGERQESGFLTNVRQRKLVEDSLAALDRAVAAASVEDTARDGAAGPLQHAASPGRHHRRHHCRRHPEPDLQFVLHRKVRNLGCIFALLRAGRV